MPLLSMPEPVLGCFVSSSARATDVEQRFDGMPNLGFWYDIFSSWDLLAQNHVLPSLDSPRGLPILISCSQLVVPSFHGNIFELSGDLSRDHDAMGRVDTTPATAHVQQILTDNVTGLY
jgi:hypothetical protein